MARGAHRTVAVELDGRAREPRQINWPWYLVAVFGPLLVLLAGWLVLAGLTALAWLTSSAAMLPSALQLAGQFLVLAHWGPVHLGTQPVSIAPLGLTVMLVFFALPIAQLATRLAASQGGSRHSGQTDPERVVLRVAGIFTAVYTIALCLLAFGLHVASPQALLGGLVVSGIAGLWGGCRAVGYDPTKMWPTWLQAVPRAMLAAGATVLVVGTVTLTWALINGADRVGSIVDALGGSWPAVVLLLAIHLLYLPNFVLACCSWVLGAGVSVGDDSLITVTMTDVGVLPAIPIFGIVPTPGPVAPVALWWLAVAALGGVAAALIVVLARPRARFDETALVGGLAGVLAGLLITLACSLGGGALGAIRLAQIGARVPQLAIFAPTVLGLSGVLAGLVLGLVRRPKRVEPDEQTQPLESAP